MTEAELISTMSDTTQREIDEVCEFLKAGKREYLHPNRRSFIVEMFVTDQARPFDGTEPTYLIGIIMMAYRRLAGLDQMESHV